MGAAEGFLDRKELTAKVEPLSSEVSRLEAECSDAAFCSACATPSRRRDAAPAAGGGGAASAALEAENAMRARVQALEREPRPPRPRPSRRRGAAPRRRRS